MKISANDSDDNEVQFNIRDESFQSVTEEENEKASKNDVLVSITPKVPVITKIKQTTCGDANTTPNDVERIRTQEPQKPQKNENQEENKENPEVGRDPQVDNIKKHLFDSPMASNASKSDSLKENTPLNVSLKGTPVSSISKLRESGNCNDGTPIDLPKLKPLSEPPTPPNKNEVQNIVLVEDVLTIKKHLFDSPVPSSKFSVVGNVDETENEEIKQNEVIFGYI